MPMEPSGPAGPGAGAHQFSGSNVPTPWYHRYHVTHAESNLRTHRALSEPTFRYASKGVLYHDVGGTVTHQVRCGDVV